MNSPHMHITSLQLRRAGQQTRTLTGALKRSVNNTTWSLLLFCLYYTALFHHKMVAKNRIETGLDYIYACKLVSLCFFCYYRFSVKKRFI